MKSVGVIPEPEVTQFELADNQKFIILASDGVWEFISSQVIGSAAAFSLLMDVDCLVTPHCGISIEQEAVDIVSRTIDFSANVACEELIGVAKSRWEEEEGDYRDDVRICFLFSSLHQFLKHKCAVMCT